MIQRKIIAASISSVLFVLIFSFPYHLQEVLESISIIYSVLTVVFPIILIYGVITSIISDAIGKLLTRKIGNHRDELIVSGVLHMLFGLIFFIFSLIAAVVFFVTDKILARRNKTYTWVQAGGSLLIPATFWLLSFGFHWILDK